jgi:cell shape-determining protein MreD
MGLVPVNLFASCLVLVAAWLAVFVESVFDLTRWLLGAQVDLLAPLMVYAALACDLPTVLLLAGVGGLWFDSLSANPLGVTTLALLGPGLLLHLRRGLILRNQLTARLILGWVICGVVPLLSVLLLLTLRQDPLLGWHSLWRWLLVTLVGGLLTPLVFQTLDSVTHSLSYRRVHEPGTRPDREIRRGRM